MRRAFAISAVAAGLLLGCSDGGDSGDADGETAAPAASQQPTQGQLEALDSGVQVHVDTVGVDGGVVRVSVAALNGNHEEVQLGRSEPELTDNADNRYEYRPPETNQELLIPSGDMLRGTMVFEIVDPGWEDESPEPGTRFHLRVNPHGMGQPSAEFTDLAPTG
jgi:hypothetical protein